LTTYQSTPGAVWACEVPAAGDTEEPPTEQSKTENILMERKEEISIQGSVHGISLQQGCCHLFSEKNTYSYLLALLLIMQTTQEHI